MGTWRSSQRDERNEKEGEQGTKEDEADDKLEQGTPHVEPDESDDPNWVASDETNAAEPVQTESCTPEKLDKLDQLLEKTALYSQVCFSCPFLLSQMRSSFA